MIQKPIDVLASFPIRKSKEQKQAFRSAVIDYAQKLGYCATVEEGKRGVRNVVIGDPNRASYLITAHYDTPASIGLPNLIAPNNPVMFFLLQFVLVGILAGVAVLTGFVAFWLGAEGRVPFLAGYAVYMFLLLLMLFGPANRNNANDNTSGVVTVLETMTALPEQLRSQVCFVLFDLEEAGLVGSAVYRKQHKDVTENQVVLNMDCVGHGDVIQITPVKKAKEDKALLERLSAVCGKTGNKELRLRSRGFYQGSSDHKNFPKGVAIMAFQYQKGLGLYCGRIHTWRDKILDTENVSVLRDALVALLSNEK